MLGCGASQGDFAHPTKLSRSSSPPDFAFAQTTPKAKDEFAYSAATTRLPLAWRRASTGARNAPV
jgi:hypothetical protein